MKRYFVEDIIRRDKQKLAQVNDAMRDLAKDKRQKAVDLYNKFAELKEFLEESIESNEIQYQIEKELGLTKNR